MVGWETKDSSFLDDADVTIASAYFGTDARYMGGDQLIFIIEGTSPESTEEGEAVRQFWSIGSGWETNDGGKTVEGKKEFQTSCNYAQFFKAALELDGVAKIIQKRGGPDRADIWAGLAFHMERIKIDRGENIGTKEVLIPVKFLGGEETKAKKSKKVKADKPTPGLRKKVKALARKHDDFEEFLDAVHAKYPEVADDEDLYDEVLDETQLWAEVN